MKSGLRRLLAIVVSVAFVAGCAMPGESGRTGSSGPEGPGATWPVASVATKEPGGTPWKAWNIRGAMTNDTQVRLEDDFYTAATRDSILQRNEHPNGSMSVNFDREYEIADEMFDFLTSDKRGSDETQHDLDCLRSLYDLYQNWEERDADGVEPVRPVVERLRSIKTIDEFTEWLCSDDFRLTGQWIVNSQENTTETNISLFALELYNDVDGEVVDPGDYVVVANRPVFSLAPFDWDDEDVLNGGKVDEECLQQLREASNTVDIAYRMLQHMGFSEDEAADIVAGAAALEAVIDESVDSEGDTYATYSHDEFAAACEGGFPLNRIVDAYGYTDASAYVMNDPTYFKEMGDYYTQDNLEFLVSHALTSLAFQCSTLLDSEAMGIAYDAHGDDYISDELLEAAAEQAEEEGQSESAGVDSTADAVPDMTEEEYAAFIRHDGMAYLRSALPTSFAKVYVENFYDPHITEEVDSMVKRYIASYEKMLMAEDWLSLETRQQAVEKLRAMRVYLAHPSKWAPTNTLRIASHDEGGSLFTQTRSLAAYDLEQELYMLRHPEEGEYWRDCMDVNAYYSVGTNSITIGAGILGGIYWPEGGSFEEKLAGMGVTIGHEISHAFDNTGAYFDKNGAYESWWTEDDLAAFEQRVQRVVECFDAIDPDGNGPYDGANVCDEAIADMGGMKVSMVVASEEKAFDYDAFFRAYANGWSSVATPEFIALQLEVDTHPVDSHRVNVPVRETDEFYKTYAIDKSDGMWLDPDQRISVW